MLAHHAIAAVFLTLAVVLLPENVESVEFPPKLAGQYVVVGIRIASDVAAPLDIREGDASMALIGTTLNAGDTISWYRERCDLRAGPPEKSPALVEPNLADLQIAPASTDSRLNQNAVVDCLGRSVNDIWQVLIVDARVLVARTMPFTTYLILEQPLAPGDVKLLKEKLARAGFGPGSKSEDMDDSTRAAIAAFANKNGAPAMLLPGIVTENLLNALAAIR
jgi:hypothetical protein